jgi:hypothetical protein
VGLRRGRGSVVGCTVVPVPRASVAHAKGSDPALAVVTEDVIDGVSA